MTTSAAGVSPPRPMTSRAPCSMRSMTASDSAPRARAFSSEKPGLEPVEQRESGLRYVCAADEFAIFVSAGLQFGTRTQMGWEVEDIDATVRELRVRGVELEEYDLPGLKTVDGIAEITRNYPSKGSVSGARGSATVKVTCWESDSRFDLDGRLGRS